MWRIFSVIQRFFFLSKFFDLLVSLFPPPACPISHFKVLQQATDSQHSGEKAHRLVYILVSERFVW